ncbi:hypothetical protein F2Q69_00012632 [Brassica cretica]|uniref:Uncharacterized protein n=1 Tax=Brassica cretica TaxID=69181 RepID=A0A8S9QVB2_BRACR|nr:hypothetical protein F2Q69_00012632 [Brassica cretica]
MIHESLQLATVEPNMRRNTQRRSRLTQQHRSTVAIRNRPTYHMKNRIQNERNSSPQISPLRPKIQAHVETDSLLAEACGKGTSSSRISEVDKRAAIDREIQESTDRAKKKPLDVNMTPSIDRHPKFSTRAFDLFRARKFHWEDKDEYGIYRDDQGCSRDMDGHIINVSKEEIRKLMDEL